LNPFIAIALPLIAMIERAVILERLPGRPGNAAVENELPLAQRPRRPGSLHSKKHACCHVTQRWGTPVIVECQNQRNFRPP